MSVGYESVLDGNDISEQIARRIAGMLTNGATP